MTPGAGLRRSQELHLRPEPHSYLPELGKSEMEFMESKRPRLELLPDPLLRPSALLATGQPSGSEDLTKVRPGPGWEPVLRWVLLLIGGRAGVCAQAEGCLGGGGQAWGVPGCTWLAGAGFPPAGFPRAGAVAGEGGRRGHRGWSHCLWAGPEAPLLTPSPVAALPLLLLKGTSSHPPGPSPVPRPLPSR